MEDIIVGTVLVSAAGWWLVLSTASMRRKELERRIEAQRDIIGVQHLQYVEQTRRLDGMTEAYIRVVNESSVPFVLGETDGAA